MSTEGARELELETELARAEQPDRWIYRFVVLALGLTLFGSMVGAVGLVYLDKAIPDLLVATGTGSLGVLGGLLAPTPRGV